MLSARASVAIGMVLIAVSALTAHALFGTMWSNHCDPGNERFNVLKSDAVVAFRASGELFAIENDGADNSWLMHRPGRLGEPLRRSRSALSAAEGEVEPERLD